MSRLEEIKNEYAKKRGYKDFNEMYIDSNFKETNHYIGVIMQMYATECVKASLEKASEKSTIFKICDDCDSEFHILNSIATVQPCPHCSKSNHIWAKINKESITNKSNNILL